MAEEQTTVVPIVSSTGEKLFRVEARTLGGRERVSVLQGISEEQLRAPLVALGKTVAAVIEKIAPAKATAEFDIEIGIESGQLTALLCKGSGKANLKVTLEWGAGASSGS
jgi:Trypsin-co-occurring domain 1